MEADDDDVVGERTAGQTGAGAARNERQSLLGKKSNDGDGLFARAREHCQSRLPAVARQAVGVVDQQLTLTAQYVGLTYDLGQARGDHYLNLAIGLRPARRRRAGAHHAPRDSRAASPAASTRHRDRSSPSGG